MHECRRLREQLKEFDNLGSNAGFLATLPPPRFDNASCISPLIQVVKQLEVVAKMEDMVEMWQRWGWRRLGWRKWWRWR